MVRHAPIALFAGLLWLAPIAARGDADGASSSASAVWPVATSLRATIVDWSRRAGWPAPQFLTDADWPVDVPGTISGSIEQALTVLVEGFGSAAARPRIVLAANHVILVSDSGEDR
jgi:hypothetical protein